MTVGVIITVYNLEHFVARAIESVLAQSHPPNRVVVINDGSTDGSLEVIQRYSDITVIDNTNNRGVLPSIIEGLRVLDTDIVAFLDGDDVWHRDKLRRVREEFGLYPDAMMVTHSYRWIDAMGEPLGVQDETHGNLARIVKVCGGDKKKMDAMLKKSVLSYAGVWLGSAFAIRRSALDLEAFAYWSESIAGHHLSHQDQPLAAWLIHENPSATLVYIDEKLFDYRVFGANSSGNTKTLDKALFTIARSRATVARTHNLVHSMGRPEELAIQEYKLRELDYLTALYTGKRILALKLFVDLLKNFWKKHHVLKELKRFGVVVSLGPRNFFRIKEKFR